MAKKSNKPPSPPAPPQIFEATLGSAGRVIKGAALTEAQAVARRKLGLDVVVCGPDMAANRRLANG